MRKWTKSACVVLAWSIVLLIVTAAVSELPGRSAQANTSIASYTQSTLTSESVNARTAKAAARPIVTWTVRSGDTLSGIAAALAVPGGWPALYAANRAAIGPNPNIISPGTTLTLPGGDRPTRHAVAPGPAASAARGQERGRAAAPSAASPSRQARVAPRALRRTPARPRPAPKAVPKAVPKAAAGPAPAGMPQWLKDVLLVTGLLAATSFAAEPVAVLARRRRTPRHAKPSLLAAKADLASCAATRARIVLADHERLVITYSTQDDTVYVLTPPGEDPHAVLRAARLILPEDTYEDLADHLGVPSALPLE